MDESSPAPRKPLLLHRCEQIQLHSHRARLAGKTVGLVATMGALHEGHLSLVEASQHECEVTIVSIFVNPTQFAAHEDLNKYPRTLDSDLEKLSPYQVDAVFAPSAEEMYPPGFSTYIQPPACANRWEGEFRPDHFRGVCTVVLKLFNVTQADVAYFGQKDYQQALVLRRMTEDLNVPVRIQVCPIIRDADGLALSSRNAFLSPEERTQALALSRSLEQAELRVSQGEQDPAVILQLMQTTLQTAGIDQIDYLTLANPETLEPATDLHQPVVAAIACRIGNTRLIDNRLLGQPAAEPPASE
ncbi:pantoate--beta-alanine ligase [Lignipirellula cremea]|uniref:Pantothenate synthetase n=1 Tax=Lignipirellula cremea TaxID=2528010 RepID=A0A518DZF8_9BACT|nr:pantoate--beta-alanine ligase [Lignipirellula cremea]QDU97230.1 Pantoate-beta-alanine ligase [Lignipirellula cremea]